MLPELFNFALGQLRACQSSFQEILVPALPGVHTKSRGARLARILSGRFKIPRICFAPAPLCALLGHGITTGTVLWGCSVGKSAVCSYIDAREVAVVGPFDFHTGTPADVAALLQRTAECLGPEAAALALARVVFSSHGPITRVMDPLFSVIRGHDAKTQAKNADCPEDEKPSPPWTQVDIVKALVAADDAPRVLKDIEFHAPLDGDVLLGADALASMPDRLASFRVKPEIKPTETNSWEWRLFADGKWQRLPIYCASVIEAAFRQGAPQASVNIGFHEYLVADLQNFMIGISTARRPFRYQGADDSFPLKCPKFQLTRFLQGRPSVVPDCRLPADLEPECRFTDEVIEEVDCDEAFHVRTIAGRIVYSKSKSSLLKVGDFVQDVLEDISAKCAKPADLLQLLFDDRMLESTQTLHSLMAGVGSLELVLMIKEKEAESKREIEEFIPEDWPGDEVDLNHLSGGKSMF